MKTVFEFYCKSEEFRIVKPITFIFGKFSVEFKSEKKDFDFKVYLTSPGEYKEIPLEVEEALVYIREFMQFTHKDFTINRGMDLFTVIPENEDEKKKIGEGLQSGQMRFKEMSRGVNLDEPLIKKMENFYPVIKLLSQFNKAEKSHSQIDKYLNYFKILEDSYYSENTPLKEALKSQNELVAIMDNTMIEDYDKKKEYKISNIPETIDELIDLRHQCAHLKSRNNFGFSETDIRSIAKLSQYVGLIRHISLNIIDKRWIELDK